MTPPVDTEWHIRTLAKLHVVAGAVCLVGAAYLAVQLLPFRSGLPPIDGDPVMGLLNLGLIAVGLFNLLLFLAAGLMLCSGIGLLGSQSWAHGLALAVSILMTPLFPVGTAVAIYGLWTLPDLDAPFLPPGTSEPFSPLHQKVHSAQAGPAPR